jgi:hypothetical protein
MQSKEEKGYLELVSSDRRRHGPLDEQLVFTVWLQIRDQSSLSQPQLEKNYSTAPPQAYPVWLHLQKSLNKAPEIRVKQSAVKLG